MTLPQILAFTKISEKGTVTLKKAVMNYLQILEEHPITLINKEEILLSKQEAGLKLSIVGRNRVKLPSYILEKLGINSSSKVCFVAREKATAIKRFDISVIPKDFSNIFDIETPLSVTRTIETSNKPTKIYQQLKEQKEKLKLRYNLPNFWQNNNKFSGWKARKLLNKPASDDNALQQDLIYQLLKIQHSNGSWEDLPTTTAKHLLQLHALGLNNNFPQVQQAISWLIDRPESPHNPGMFFLTDDLVEEQQEIISKREEQTSGSRPRFRYRKKSELNLITAVDELYYNPCGQRIMWVNAIVMEALLAFGYEYHERIQAAIETLSYGNWCECGYQHGTSSWKREEPLSTKEIADFEQLTKFEFEHCGIQSLELLSKIVSNHLKRIEVLELQNSKKYLLRLPLPQQGCEYITVGALHQVKNENLNRLVEAHLWRFAILLHNLLQQPQFLPEVERYNLSIYFQLQVLSKYDTLAAKLAILRALPWIIEHQNADGSWGTLEYKESATLAVISALKRVNFI